jgi:hypothetical protein
MKNLLKIAAVAVLSLGFGVAAQAQLATATMNTNAQVFDQVKVNVERSLNFGQVMTGSTKTINLDNTASTSATGAASPKDVQVGVFSLLAGKGSQVRLTFTLPTQLDGTGEDAVDMPISFSTSHAAFGATANINYGSHTPFNPNAPHDFNSFPENTINFGTGANAGSGNGVYIYIGGEVNGANMPSNTYSGTITLTATYN